MRIIQLLSSVPSRVYTLIFLSVTVLAGAYSYILYDDTRAVEQRIQAKQKELGRVVALRDKYIAKKRSLEQVAKKASGEKVMSLSIVEETVSKSFVSGRLTTLKPSTLKEEKGKNVGVIEVKVTNAALGEVISFVKALESSGLFVKKLQINLPGSGQAYVDMYALVAGG
jgi:hypothetical protein